MARSLQIKQNQLCEWQKQLETQKEEIDVLQVEIYQQEAQFSESQEEMELLRADQRGIEESYTQISLKEHERMYGSYLADNNDYFKKIKFQFGKNYLTKVQQKVPSQMSRI